MLLQKTSRMTSGFAPNNSVLLRKQSDPSVSLPLPLNLRIPMRHMALRAVVRAPMLLLPTRGHVALPVGKVFHSACMTDFLLGHATFTLASFWLVFTILTTLHAVSALSLPALKMTLLDLFTTCHHMILTSEIKSDLRPLKVRGGVKILLLSYLLAHW